VVGKIEEFCYLMGYWFAEVNAPTQTLNLVDVAAKGGSVEDDDDLDDEVVFSNEEGEAAVAEQKEIDDDEAVREKTTEGTVTLV